MKKIIESLFALGMLFATVGCDQDQIVAKFDTSGEDAGTAYFVKNAVSENFEASATGTQTINLDLFRQDAAGELTVGLTAEMDEAAAKFFRIPESVTFADGDYRVIVPVSVLDVEKFDKGVTYAVSISVNNAGTENESSASIGSKYASVTLSASLTLNWVPCYVLKDFSKLLSTDLTDADYVVGPDGKPMLQGGVYTYTFWWEGEDDTVMLERAEGTNVFRLTNWGGGVNILFTINADKTISLTSKYVGEDYSDGTKVLVSDLPSTGVGTDVCTWDGDRTFTFPLVYLLEDGRWFGETCVETFVLNDGSASLE